MFRKRSLTLLVPQNCSNEILSNCYLKIAEHGQECLWEDNHVPRVVGSKPSTVYMDIFSYLLVVSQCLFEKTKINKKAHFFKKRCRSHSLGRSSEQRARLLFRRSEFESYCSVQFFLVKIFYKEIAGD